MLAHAHTEKLSIIIITYVIPIYVHCIIRTRIIYVYAQYAYVSLGKYKNFEFLLW